MGVSQDIPNWSGQSPAAQLCGEGRAAELPPPMAFPIFWAFYPSLPEQSALIPPRTFSSEGPRSSALQASPLANRDALKPPSSPRAIACPASPWTPNLSLPDPRRSRPTPGSRPHTRPRPCLGGLSSSPRAGGAEPACLGSAAARWQMTPRAGHSWWEWQ